METVKVINIVATECHSDDDAKFNTWYDEIHIPMLLKFDGMLGVTRYKLSSGTTGQAKYLAIYEFKNKASFDAFQKSSELAAARDCSQARQSISLLCGSQNQANEKQALHRCAARHQRSFHA